MLKRENRYYLTIIFNKMREAMRFKIVGGSATNGAILFQGGFVSWSDGTGKLKYDGANWSIVTKSGNDYVDGDVITPDYPYYEQDHTQVLEETLASLSKIRDKKKYPLAFIREDIIRLDLEDGATLSGVALYFLTLTEKTYKSIDRDKNTFGPLLRPLFNVFMTTLDSIGIVSVINQDVERKYWGRQETHGNQSNVLSDPIDGLEISIDLEINEFNFNCTI